MLANLGKMDPMDRAEMRTMLERNHEAAYGWALHCSRGDREEAADLLHTVYVQLLEKPEGFQQRSTFKTWLFAVIRKNALKRRGRLWAMRARLRDLVLGPRQASSQEKRVFDGELRRAIQRLLERISERQREVLRLVFYHDLTVEQAAEVMGVSVGSARTHYQRGKQSLYEAIQESGLRHEFIGEGIGDKAAV
jgi:RNA polymerase sigma-70 factor, ECF subfamily